MTKYLSRGIACQTDGCPQFAHEEFIPHADDPIGSGTMLCHWDALLFRREHGLGNREFPCIECGDLKVCKQCQVESDSRAWKLDDICRTCSLGNMVEMVKALAGE